MLKSRRNEQKIKKGRRNDEEYENIVEDIMIFRKKKEIKNESFVFGILAFGVLLLFMATTLFPWELLQQNKLINMFAGTVRMPWRFLSLASPIFCIAAAIIIGAVSKSDMSKRIVIMVTPNTIS